MSDRYILWVFLYRRKAGEADYSYVRMTWDNGLFRAEIPSQPAGFKHPENPALDYNGDGGYSLSDALDALGLLSDIQRIRRPS